MDKQHDKRIRRTRRRSGSENAHRFSRTKTKKKSNWETPRHDGIHGFWFKKITSIQDRQALEMNKCQQGTQELEWITK